MEDNNPIHIVFGIDRNYVQHCTVVMLSIIETYREDEKIVFHIIQNDLTDTEKNNIKETVEGGNFVVDFISIPIDWVKDCPMKTKSTMRNDTTISVYYRLFITDLLPKEIEKILYLDSDVLVFRSIDELYNIDIKDFAIAGVRDSVETSLKEKLGYKEPYPYICSGVLLMNLKYLRSIDFPKLALEFIEKYHDIISLWDQDVINGLLHERTKELHVRWDMLPSFLWKDAERNKSRNNVSPLEIIEAQNEPGIIHYGGSDGLQKAWFLFSPVPYARNYYRLARKIKWRKKTIALQKPLIGTIKVYLIHLLYGPPYIMDSWLKKQIWELKKLKWKITEFIKK